jgi:hypothetical protein
MPFQLPQPRLSEVARIRIGGPKRTNRAGKSIWGERLDTFRFTGSEPAMQAIAERYGGTVEPWEDQHSVTTEYSTIPVLLPPPDEAWSLAYEMYDGAGRNVRRCDSVTCTQSSYEQGSQGMERVREEVPCICKPLVEEEEKRPECSPKSRLNFLLVEVPLGGISVYSTTSEVFASETSGTFDIEAMWASQIFQAEGGMPSRSHYGFLHLEDRRMGENRFKLMRLELTLDWTRSISMGAGPTLPEPGPVPQIEAVVAEDAPQAEKAKAKPPAKPRKKAAPAPRSDSPAHIRALADVTNPSDAWTTWQRLIGAASDAAELSSLSNYWMIWSSGAGNTEIAQKIGGAVSQALSARKSALRPT